MQAQRDLVVGTVHDKGNMEQVILEIQKRFEAVSVDPNLFPQVCFWLKSLSDTKVSLSPRDTFKVAICFSQEQKPDRSPVMTKVKATFLLEGSLA